MQLPARTQSSMCGLGRSLIGAITGAEISRDRLVGAISAKPAAASRDSLHIRVGGSAVNDTRNLLGNNVTAIFCLCYERR